jgi:uncharacterized membrane protein YvbJ
MIICPRCGYQNYDNVPFCQNCRLPFSQQSQYQQYPQQQFFQQQSPQQYGPFPQQPINQPFQPDQKDPWWKTVLPILGWIFIYPLMLTLDAIKKNSLQAYIAAGGSWLFYILILILAFTG